MPYHFAIPKWDVGLEKHSEYLNTLAKLTPQKTKAKFYYALFSESGFDKKIEAEAEHSDTLSLYDLETIVNYKK